MNLSDTDLKQIESKGLTAETITSQFKLLSDGLPYISLERSAAVDKGILKVSKTEQNKYIALFEAQKDKVSIVKFVPASGSATRMFKSLLKFIKHFNPQKERLNAYVNKHKAHEISLFFLTLNKLPFYKKVIDLLKTEHPNYKSLNIDEQRLLFAKILLDAEHLNYSQSPKGLLPFHKYKDHIATAFEEHCFEASLYASSNNSVNLHFTISKKNREKFENAFHTIKSFLEEQTNNKIQITFSYQNKNTDTIAITQNNKVFRDSKGGIVFRPAGHGALLSNLNTINADLIFIKNIDNVVVKKHTPEVAYYKKLLAGILIKLQEESFNCLKLLEKPKVSSQVINRITQFAKHQLNIELTNDFRNFSFEKQKAYLQKKLNRPLRVCGVVKNEGEVGGGPFWVRDEKGELSLQIIESAQVDKANQQQLKIFKTATHFNPVDIVCGIKNYKGNCFNLKDFVNPNMAFIAKKTELNQSIKTLELPGLWNGSMAYWNTVLVEVPLITFNPVKTVTDLLNNAHQENNE